MIGLILVAFAAVVLFGVWRRFGPVQWIWLLFGAAIVMIVVWLVLIIAVVEPEMRRHGPPLPERGSQEVGSEAARERTVVRAGPQPEGNRWTRLSERLDTGG
jgi:uncharacterized membrane protein